MGDLSGDVIVLTSCTATKVAGPNDAPRTAESLYAGQQHVRLMQGVNEYRRAGQPAGRLKLRIVSAGHGLLPASRRVKGYDQTFQGLPRDAIRRRADKLGIPTEVAKLLKRPYALALVLLGDDYLEACGIEPETELGGPTLIFSGPRVGQRLPALTKMRHVAVSNPEARRFGYPTISVKGELARRALIRLAKRPEELPKLVNKRTDVLRWLDDYDAGFRRNGHGATR